MGPCGACMMSKENAEDPMITTPEPMETTTTESTPAELKENFEDLDEAVGTDDLKPVKFMGVDFPIYFQGPHWIQYNGTFMLAVDPAYVTMPMKANWMAKYAPELMALGKQILEKNLNIKIEIR